MSRHNLNISKEDSCRSGVYIIRNTINKKIYIGSTNRLKERFYKHLSMLRNQKHTSKQLQAFYNKYGSEVLIFEVLEFCIDAELLTIEQRYIDEMQPFNKKGFNTLTLAGSPKGYSHAEESKTRISVAHTGRKHTEESRKNMAIGQQNRDWKLSDEGRLRQSIARRGRVVIESTREKISRANKGRVHSDQSKRNMSEAHKGKFISEDQKRNQSIEMMERNPFGKLVLNLETGIYYDSGIQAAKAHNLHAIGLNRKLRGERRNNTQFVLA